MGVAPLPGGAHALVFGRELPRDEFEFKDSATRGAAPFNVLRQRASNEPVCPSLHCTKTAGNDDSSMAFDMLFDSMDDVDAVDMDDIQEDSESDEDRDEDTHDPVSVYVRIVRTLSRPKSSLEHSIHKRFAAACDEVGPGEVGDALHIEQLRRAFNAYAYDPWGEPVRKRPKSPPTEGFSSPEAKRFAEADEAAGDGCAFVATTPGAVGHAALLNLRHSFLWLNVPNADGDGDIKTQGAHNLPVTASPQLASVGEHAKPGYQERYTPGSAIPAALGKQRGAFAEPAVTCVLLMEPDIKAHFVISRPTASYQRLVQSLPKCFVGTHQALVKLVDFMCEQMQFSFAKNEMSIPPWRKNKAILSKWCLPTAKQPGSSPSTPTMSPEGSRKKNFWHDSTRRMSFDLVGGGEVLGVGQAYGGEFDVSMSRIGVGAGA